MHRDVCGHVCIWVQYSLAKFILNSMLCVSYYNQPYSTRLILVREKNWSTLCVWKITTAIEQTLARPFFSIRK